MRSSQALLRHDLVIIAVSVAFAYLLVRTGALEQALTAINHFRFVSAIIAGMCFTTIFTTPAAIVALGTLSQINGIPETALFGAVGALIGDLGIFHFIRDRFGHHITQVIRHQSVGRRLIALSHTRSLRWASLLVGGLIIASPLPDELGISLIGFSNISTFWFGILSYSFNFAGIVIIGLVAQRL